MRVLIGMAVAACASLPSVVEAGVSDDLVFCSKLANGRERIACYDAAARLAAAGSSRSIEPRQKVVTMPAAGVPVAESYIAPIFLPFQGFYIAGGGSYGIATEHPFQVFDAVSTFNGTAHPSGFSGVAAAGYNLQYGHLVTGIELSGRYGQERFSQSQSDTAGPNSFILSGTSTKSYEFNIDSGVHLALRAGLAVDNTLIYGKIGIGAAHSIQKSMSAANGTQCNSFGNSGCLIAAPFTSMSSESLSQWLPSLLLGAGIEQNFGTFFARIGGEAEAVRGPLAPNEFYWTIRATALLGVRF